MGLLKGRKGLIFGIANDRSIATYIAKSAVAEGAVFGADLTDAVGRVGDPPLLTWSFPFLST